VHGGEKFPESVLITPEVTLELRNCIELAPLHNPHNIRGINACQRILSNIPQVAVFDTAFHQQMPKHAYIYGLPYILYKKYGIRRYGFHGTSHFYVSRRASQLLKKPIKELKIITCHLGNGASMSAVKEGISIDTSMGFTPLEGLLMGTRCGDLDPAVILHIMAREELTLQEANTLLNKHSGIQGISGQSSDMRDIIQEAKEGHANSKLALEIYCYRIKKYIGAYAAAMGGLDSLVFTAGIGENSPLIRERCCAGLEFLGIEIDEDRNDEAIGVEGLISKDKSRVRVFSIPTNEELVIAEETRKVLEVDKFLKETIKGV
jgi:acetate kinase